MGAEVHIVYRRSEAELPARENRPSEEELAFLEAAQSQLAAIGPRRGDAARRRF